MQTNNNLFGYPSETMRPLCILTPFLPSVARDAFSIKTIQKGFPFRCGHTDTFSVIETRVGAPFAGDAVLWLSQTPCQRIILFGSCGAVNDHGLDTIGSLVSPKKSYAFESFSQLATAQTLPPKVPCSVANKKAMDVFLSFSRTKNIIIKSVTTACFASLYLERDYHAALKKRHIDTIEMESSAVFSAARKTGIPTLALFYITDIMGIHDPLKQPNPTEQKKIDDAITQAAELITSFARQAND